MSEKRSIGCSDITSDGRENWYVGRIRKGRKRKGRGTGKTWPNGLSSKRFSNTLFFSMVSSKKEMAERSAHTIFGGGIGCKEEKHCTMDR